MSRQNDASRIGSFRQMYSQAALNMLDYQRYLQNYHRASATSVNPQSLAYFVVKPLLPALYAFEKADMKVCSYLWWSRVHYFNEFLTRRRAEYVYFGSEFTVINHDNRLYLQRPRYNGLFNMKELVCTSAVVNARGTAQFYNIAHNLQRALLAEMHRLHRAGFAHCAICPEHIMLRLDFYILFLGHAYWQHESLGFFEFYRVHDFRKDIYYARSFAEARALDIYDLALVLWQFLNYTDSFDANTYGQSQLSYLNQFSYAIQLEQRKSSCYGIDWVFNTLENNYKRSLEEVAWPLANQGEYALAWPSAVANNY